MANEMRDRLVELIKQVDSYCTSAACCYKCMGHGKGADCFDYLIADHLIENGVIVPPCKVGETVYCIHKTHWDENYKDYIKSEKLKQGVLQVVYSPKLKTNLMLEVKEFDWDLFNNWMKGEVFLTKEAAEQKLKEMRGDTNA